MEFRLVSLKETGKIDYLVWVLYPDACIGLIRKLNTKNTPQLAAIGIFYSNQYK